MSYTSSFRNSTTNSTPKVATEDFSDRDPIDWYLNGAEGHGLSEPVVLAQMPDQSAVRIAQQFFKRVSVLDREVAFFIPSQDRNGQPIDHQLLLQTVGKTFRTLFGGLTAIKGYGSSEELSDHEVEGIAIVSSFTTDALLVKQVPHILALAKWILAEFNQDSVAVKVNNIFLLLE